MLHKGLKLFVNDDNAKGLPQEFVPKIRRIISFLQDMKDESELRDIPSWNAHLLTGDRKGTWSLSVSRNWRITLSISQDGIEIIDLNFEDYH